MLDKTLTYYLTGPMSGLPSCNIPLFDSATFALRGAGYKIISPGELDSPAVRAEGLASAEGVIKSESWGCLLGRDVKIVADHVGGLILLPGWQRSRGARLEVLVGLFCNKEFGLFDPATDAAIPTDRVHIHRWFKDSL